MGWSFVLTTVQEWSYVFDLIIEIHHFFVRTAEELHLILLQVILFFSHIQLLLTLELIFHRSAEK